MLDTSSRRSHKGHLSNTVQGTRKDEGVGRSSDSGLLRPTCILFICSLTAVWIIICINAQFPLVLGTLSRPRTAPEEDLPGRRNMCTIRRQVQPLSSSAEGIVLHGGCLPDTEVLIMPLSICQRFASLRPFVPPHKIFGRCCLQPWRSCKQRVLFKNEKIKKFCLRIRAWCMGESDSNKR